MSDHGHLLSIGVPLFLGAVGCGPIEPTEIDRTPQALLGGTDIPDERWPAVMALGGGACSGVLVTPDTVIYAAHCGDWFPFVTVANNEGRRDVAIQTCEVHPDGGAGNGWDIGYCILTQPLADVTPRPLSWGAEVDSPVVGDSLIVVGFGQETEELGPGNKKMSKVTVSDTSDDFGNIPVSPEPGGGVCGGDSGAPVFQKLDDESFRVVALVSFTYEAECLSTEAYLQPLPPVLDWLESASGRELDPFEYGPFDHGAPARTAEPGTCSTSNRHPVSSPVWPHGVWLALLLIAGARRTRPRAARLTRWPNSLP